MLKNCLSTVRRHPWPLSSLAAPKLDSLIPIEEENAPNYHPDRFYPVRLGEVFHGQYQIATKLGHGANSTTWLARDLHNWRWTQERYVAIKVNAIDSPTRRLAPENEVEIMRHISGAHSKHQGGEFVRKLYDSFLVEGKNGSHVCLVLEPLREPLWIYQQRFIGGVIPIDTLKLLIRMILLALDFLHSECHIVHTDIKPGNILIKAEDPSIFAEDAEKEFIDPLPQKVLDDRIIYRTRNNFGPLRRPTGLVEVIDFDLANTATPGQKHHGAIQSEIYRSPEVIVDSGYDTSADIWSLGVMLWDLVEGKALFKPQIPGKPAEYDDGAHLGQIIALLGSPPGNLLSVGNRTSMFFNNDGTFKRKPLLPEEFTLEATISCITGQEKLGFIKFVKRMLTWSPEERSSAKELLEDNWFYEDFPQD